MLDGTIRSRSLMWFATGVVLTLLATVLVMNAWRADAAPGDGGRTTFVPITPCRLMDTRPAPDRVGNQSSFGVQDTKSVKATGVSGNCTTIPAEATAVSLNVTALNATEPGFIAVWPSGERPLSSNLNPGPGQRPIPNAVQTPLDAGSFLVYNHVGSVDVIIDANGYYLPALGAFEVVSQSFAIDLTAAGDQSGRSVSCPAGKLLTGGGASITDNAGLDIESSVPRSDMTGWSGRVRAESSPYDGTLNVYVVCASGISQAP